MAKKFALLYIVIVCSILLTPGVLWLSGVRDPQPFFDNRNPAGFPKFNIAHLDPYPGQFENYFNDHFPYRNSSIAFLNYTDCRYFKKSPVPDQVTIGTDGWLYPGAPHMELMMGQQPLSDEMITIMINELNDRYEKCKSLGAEYRLVVIPAKSAIYPEHLPLSYRMGQWKHPMDLLLARCSKECKVPILYLLDSLAAHKSECDLFLRTDSHWNDAGMYYSYRSIINWVQPGLQHNPPMQIDLDNYRDTIESGNYSQMLGMEEYWNETARIISFSYDTSVHERIKENYPCNSEWFTYCNEYETAFENSDTSLPGLLVMRDSYTDRKLQQLLASHFGRSTFIWDYWQYKLNKEILANEKPDVVLCIMTETSLMSISQYRNQWETGGSNFLEAGTTLGKAMRLLRKIKSSSTAI